MDDDEFLDEAVELDQDPIPGLGEVPDCDDDAIACLIAEPNDGEAR